MEDTLGAKWRISVYTQKHVLILVVMEDALGEMKKTVIIFYLGVLILVVMEDTLGATTSQRGRLVSVKS